MNAKLEMLNSTRCAVEHVELPGVGGVLVVEMNGHRYAEYSAFLTRDMDAAKAAKGEVKMDFSRVSRGRMALIALTVAEGPDDSPVRMFEGVSLDDAIETIGKWPASVVTALDEAATRVNGLDRATVQQNAKN